MAYDYKLLRVEIENRIAWVTVDAPPINVITGPLYAELSALSKELHEIVNVTYSHNLLAHNNRSQSFVVQTFSVFNWRQ